jgi:cob(I)alamin adenosyltransferase
MKIYTRTGDKGQTSLFGGERVSKAHGRVSAYGTLDELNSSIGLCIAICREADSSSTSYAHGDDVEWLLGVQRDIFAISSWLASKDASERVERGEEAFTGARQGRTHVSDERIERIERDIDRWEQGLKPMKSFLLPGGAPTAAHAHMARTLCRRAERETIALREAGEVVPELAIRYLNRLADALFVFARHLNHKAGVKEDPWQ